MVSLAAFHAYDSREFPRKFERTVSSNKDISSIVEILGKPNQTIDKTDFHENLLTNPANKSGFKAHYWSNGISSYHWVVTDNKGLVISFGSEGW